MKIFIIILLFLLTACSAYKPSRGLGKMNKNRSLHEAHKPKSMPKVDADSATIDNSFIQIEESKDEVGSMSRESIQVQYAMQASPIKEKFILPNATVVDKADTVKEARGLIAYSVPAEMKMGNEYSVKIRISKEEIKKELLNGTNDDAIANSKIKSIVTIESVRISNTMSALLTSSAEDFKIESLSTKIQDIEDLGYTEWEWNVEPLRSGKNPLKLIIKVRIANDENFKDIVVFEKNIQIKSNFSYTIKHFIAEYWQWMMSSVVFPLIIWWWNRRKKKKKKA